MFSLQLRLQRFEIVINGAIQLEQGVRTLDLLLAEQGDLPGRSGSRTTTPTRSAPCSAIFAGNRVHRISRSTIENEPSKIFRNIHQEDNDCQGFGFVGMTFQAGRPQRSRKANSRRSLRVRGTISFSRERSSRSAMSPS